MRRSFWKDNITGKIGENHFKNYMISKGLEVLDVSDNPKYQEEDVDFLVKGKSGKWAKFEVKNNTHIWWSHAIFFETVSNVKKGTPGCAMKTTADFIVFVSEREETLYFFVTEPLRKYVVEHLDSLKRKEVPGSNSIGYIVPIDDVQGCCRAVSWSNNNTSKESCSSNTAKD